MQWKTKQGYDLERMEFMNSYKLGNLRIVDLSKMLDPKTETRRCHLTRFNTGGPIPDFHTIIDITSHLGTHCEGPYHHDENWPSIADLPMNTFMGRAIYVVFKDVKPRSYLTPAILDTYCAPMMKKDDIVIIDSPYRILPFTELTNTDQDQRLLVNGDTAVWFRDHGAKCIGFGNGVSIENRNEDVKPFHDVLLAKNIVFLEVLQHLDELREDTFFMSYVPLPIKGLDSCPVRAYAIEGLEEFK
jgi:kynurenine formamidase